MSLTMYTGKRANLKKYINRDYLNQQYNLQQNIYSEGYCNCIQDKVLHVKQGFNDPHISESQRISQLIKQKIGGRTMFGNSNIPLAVNSLGGIEGQSGGMPKPLRNKF
jgi:hypothetical protein